MKYYDHLDVIPIYMTSLLVFNICCGLILFDEFALYTRSGFLGIVLGIGMCMSGISLLVFKNAAAVKTKAMSVSKDSEESDASSEQQEYRKLFLKYLANESEKSLSN